MMFAAFILLGLMFGTSLGYLALAALRAAKSTTKNETVPVGAAVAFTKSVALTIMLLPVVIVVTPPAEETLRSGTGLGSELPVFKSDVIPPLV